MANQRMLQAHLDVFIVADGYDQYMRDWSPNLDYSGFPGDGDSVQWSGAVTVDVHTRRIALHVYNRQGNTAIIPDRFLIWSPF